MGTTDSISARRLVRLSWDEAFRMASLERDGDWPVLREASRNSIQLRATKFQWFNGGRNDTPSTSYAQIIRAGSVSPTLALVRVLDLIEDAIVNGRASAQQVRKMAGLRSLTGRDVIAPTDAVSLRELRGLTLLSGREDHPGREPRLYEALWEGGIQVVEKAAYPEGARL